MTSKISIWFVKKKSLLGLALGIIVIGYTLLMVSRMPVFSSVRSFNELSYSYNEKRIPLFLPKQGTYYLNVTSGEILFFEEAKIRVYNDREDLVFSFPISRLPSTFTVGSSGYYVIVLENVSFALPETRLAILEEIENYEVFLPFYFMDCMGKGLFFSGICFVSLLVFYSAYKRWKKTEEKMEFQKTVQISKIIRILYAALSFLVCPLAVIVLVSVMFTPLIFDYSVIVWFVLLPLLTFYWIRLDEIVGFILSIFGYKGYLTFRLVPKLLVVIVLCMYVLTVYWATQPPVLSAYLVTNLTGWGTLPAVSFLVLTIPFIDALKHEGEARLSLKQSLAEYEQDPENAFGYIARASKIISSLLDDYNVRISSNVLSEHISLEQLGISKKKDTKKENEIIRKILKSLDPFDTGELINIVSDIPNIKEEKKSMLTFAMILECLSYIMGIAGAILTVIVVVVGA